MPSPACRTAIVLATAVSLGGCHMVEGARDAADDVLRGLDGFQRCNSVVVIIPVGLILAAAGVATVIGGAVGAAQDLKEFDNVIRHQWDDAWAWACGEEPATP